MRAALSLARRGLGNAWPNPAVGCVIVKDGLVAGRGWTQPGGRPHAETEALRRAGPAAEGATAYVTLEPCVHHGETPPCAEALIDAGISRVVSAIGDPDARVDGGGHERLREAGISVEQGCCAHMAAEANAGYLLARTRSRPLFTLKSATSIDGRIALASGESKWITGEDSRAAAHQMRLDHDATLVGIGTVLADDPRLTCRLPGVQAGRQARIVLDSNLRTPLGCNLVRGAPEAPLWIITADGKSEAELTPYGERGAEVIQVPRSGSGSGVDAGSVAEALAARGLTRVLIEGGGGVAASFLRAGLVDRLVVFRGPTAMGGDALAQFGPLGLEEMAHAPGFELIDVEAVGKDVKETYAALIDGAADN